ncbi:uncharacterized protein LOC132269111 [Cornus florida]|uniref:uncharacterized protein LOC132269111 n=1 Tax=Cornus florida TaxID=4283 RepID=UPI00289EB280|nr:uncharacterized protein LOC132269111 [Cornus florida]
MASTVILHNLFSVSLCSPKCLKKQASALNSSQLLSSKSLSKLKKRSLLSTIQIRGRKTDHTPVVYAAQSNFLRVIQTAWKVGNDGIDAGTNLVPDSIPRPIARISVTVVAVSIALFVLKSVLSTAFFVLAMMGLIYFTFIALNKDEGPRGGGGGGTTSTEDSLEEARKIMEKYK